MGKRIGEIERKYKRRSGLGPFFLGTFIGILFGIGALVGLGALAYFKATPQWINNTFKTNIDLGSDELNKITLSQAVSKALYISNNSGKYTLADFEKDFGYELPKTIKGVNIEKLKTKPLDKIGEGINDILNDVSINELSEIYTPSGDMNELLDDTLTLYVKSGFVNGDKVYSDSACTEVVDFASIENGSIKVKDISKMPVEDRTEFPLKEIPLLQGLPLYITHIGDNMTIKRLEEKFGITLPDILKLTNEDKEKNINQLGEIIDEQYLANFLDYEYDASAGKVYKFVGGVKTEVTGAVATLAKKKVKELNTLEDTIQNMKVYEVLNYTYSAGKYYDNGSEVTGIMAKLAGYTVGTLSNDVQTLSIADIMDYTIEADGTIKDKSGNTIKGVLKAIADLTIGNMSDNLQARIDDMQIADVLDLTISGSSVTDKNGNQVKGVLKAIADLKISELSTGLQTKINNLTLADVMDYSITDGKVYDSNGAEITGIMATIVKKNATINNLPTAINNLAIYEALDYVKYQNAGTTIYYKDVNNNGTYDVGEELSGVLSLINVEKGITELSDEISNIFTGTNAKTLSQLQNAGVIGKDVDLTKKIAGTTIVLGNCTIDELLKNIPTE